MDRLAGVFLNGIAIRWLAVASSDCYSKRHR